VGLAQIPQDALALVARERDLRQARRGAFCQASDVREVIGQGFGRAPRRWSLALRFGAFEKKQRIGEQPRPGLPTGFVPGGAQPGDLAAGKPVLGRGTGQLKPRVPVASHQRNQILHRRVRRDLPAAHQILDFGGKLVDQRQTARNPTRAATQTSSQLATATALAAQLGQQPTLLQRRLRGRHPQPARQEQSLTFVQLPHHRPHHVHPQAAQRADPFVTVDDPIASRLGRRDRHHRLLLAVPLQAGEQTTLHAGPAHTQARVAQLQLVGLQLKDSVGGRNVQSAHLLARSAAARRDFLPRSGALHTTQHSEQGGGNSLHSAPGKTRPC